MIQKVVRVLAWLLVVAMIVVTLAPIGMRPRLGVAFEVERILAAGALGLLLAFAYPRQFWPLLMIMSLSIIGLEWLQELRPDRHGNVQDAALKLAGGALGLGAGWAVQRLVLRQDTM
jgi:hypothetical protein